jgi:nucleotide-binding universal stress UspA family protein
MDPFAPMEVQSMPPRPEDEAGMLAKVQEHVRTVLEDQPHDVSLAVGQPIAAILSAAREQNSDLIVMGTHLRFGWRRALFGSVSEGVLHGSPCPVLTVADHDRFAGEIPYGIASILCPINFTDVARESLHVAARVAQAFHGRLTIVHIVEDDQMMNAGAHEEKIRSWVSPELRDICSYRELVARGKPAERVLDCAEDLAADLVVIGAQHKQFRDTTVLGTTTERVIRFASSPVLIVPRELVGRRVNTTPIEEPALAAH